MAHLTLSVLSLQAISVSLAVARLSRIPCTYQSHTDNIVCQWQAQGSGALSVLSPACVQQNKDMHSLLGTMALFANFSPLTTNSGKWQSDQVNPKLK